MSVYQHPKSPYWQYDFRQKGRRFYGSTGVQTRRAAEAVERKVRQDAALGLLDDVAPLTIDEAAGRWWAEVGSDLRSARDRERAIAVVVKLIGPQTPLAEVTTARISAAIERRRGATFARAPGKEAKRYLPSNTTVNRDVIDTLRPILRRARKTWEIKNLPEIDWLALRLPEPKAKALEFADAELLEIARACRPHWADFISLMQRYGLRLGEMFFPLSALEVADRDDARLTLRGRKGGGDKVIPLLPMDADILAARAGRAKAADLGTVWFRQAKPPKFGNRPPKLLALTYAGAGIALRRAMTTTGLRGAKGARGAHGLRHHAGMRVLRATGNLRTTQRLLGHADIRSTLVYADAVERDVKDALAAVSRNSPEPTSQGSDNSKQDQQLKKSGSTDL